MFFYKGLSCPHCSAPFQESDDIVACPVCGAPHHRSCWADGNGCACAADHGTDKQWSRDAAAQTKAESPANDTVRCPHCQAENSPFAELCSHCGRSLTAREWRSQATDNTPPGDAFNEYAPFHSNTPQYNGIPLDTVLEGETVRDLATVVHSNAPYYLPRFQRMATSGSKSSWNWAAFLIPSYWLLYRKQYIVGSFVLLLELLYTVVVNLVSLRYFAAAMNADNYADMTSAMMRLMQEDERAYLAAALIGMLAIAMLLMRVMIALFGNRLYMKSCLKVIRATRDAYPEGYQAQLSVLGGTSFVLAVIGYMAMQLLPSFILMLFV